MTNRQWRKRQQARVAQVMDHQARTALPASAWGTEAAKVAAAEARADLERFYAK